MLLHMLPAVTMYVLFGSGALLAFWSSAAQQFEKLCDGPPPPVGFFAESAGAAEATGTSGASSSGALGVGAATGAAEGRGGGGSSFLQPTKEVPAIAKPTSMDPKTD